MEIIVTYMRMLKCNRNFLGTTKHTTREERKKNKTRYNEVVEEMS